MSEPASDTTMRLHADPPNYNFRRIRNGQNIKVNLRDCRTGRIVATVYGGVEMANYIVKTINEKGN